MTTTAMKLCECGCGQPAPLARRAEPRLGLKEGDARRYVNGHQRRGKRKPDRWVVVDCGYTTPCWVWRLRREDDGYGRAKVDGRSIPAYRAVYEEHCGPIPDGLHLDHLCRNPGCVNPEHLEPVTPAENARRGVRTKLNPERVREIRAAREPRRALAERFGITEAAIKAVRERRTWKDIA
jgi:hypothetical protein